VGAQPVGFIGAGGVELWGELLARPSTVLLVHDAGRDLDAWSPLPELLAERGFGSFAFDLRGCGLSDGRPGGGASPPTSWRPPATRGARALVRSSRLGPVAAPTPCCGPLPTPGCRQSCSYRRRAQVPERCDGRRCAARRCPSWSSSGLRTRQPSSVPASCSRCASGRALSSSCRPPRSPMHCWTEHAPPRRSNTPSHISPITAG
jgi:hypothetical protein